MPDNIRDDISISGEEAAPREADAKEKKGKGKKKKKRRGCGFFLLMLLLAAGAAVGVQLSGGADLRPYVYWTIPRIPAVGPQLAGLVGVPAEYSLTAEDRRYIELDEWEKEIAKMKRSLNLSEDLLTRDQKRLEAKSKDVAELEAELLARVEALSNDMGGSGDMSSLSPEQKKELDRLVKMFEEMSPKNAAAILEKVNVELAVHVLNSVQQDYAARVLGRMDADVAAGLTERLAQLKND